MMQTCRCITPSLGHAFACSNGSRRVDKRFTVGTKSLIDNGIAIVDYGDCDFSFETINIRDFDNPLEIAKQQTGDDTCRAFSKHLDATGSFKLREHKTKLLPRLPSTGASRLYTLVLD